LNKPWIYPPKPLKLLQRGIPCFAYGNAMESCFSKGTSFYKNCKYLGGSFGVFFEKLLSRGWLLLSKLSVALEIFPVFGVCCNGWRSPKGVLFKCTDLQLLYCFQKGPKNIKIPTIFDFGHVFLTIINDLICFYEWICKRALHFFSICLVKVNLLKG